ncbi:MAG: hypothetical protein ACRDRN_12110 [Sciscionella sp.]
MTAIAEPVVGIADLLQKLVRCGFQFVHPRSGTGEVVAVVGIRAHDNVIDVVKLHAETDVTASRMPGDEADVLAPSSPIWETNGTASVVLHELLELPDEPMPGMASTAKHGNSSGCWVPIRPGQAHWLAAH